MEEEKISPVVIPLNFLFDNLEHLEEQVVIMKNKIKEEGRSYLKEIDILTSMKGVSVFTAIAIIADIISVKRFSSSKQFASYLRSTQRACPSAKRWHDRLRQYKKAELSGWGYAGR